MPSLQHDPEALLSRALILEYASIACSIGLGSVAFGIGLHSGSVGVLGVGLNVLADLVGSIALVWRFRAERVKASRGRIAEGHVSVLVAAALAVVSLSLFLAAYIDLARSARPGHSVFAMVVGGSSVLILAPLGFLKRRTGHDIGSGAMVGDGTMSLLGAAVGGAALMGLLVNTEFGWWWADRGVGLAISAVAASASVKVFRSRPVNNLDE